MDGSYILCTLGLNMRPVCPIYIFVHVLHFNLHISNLLYSSVCCCCLCARCSSIVLHVRCAVFILVYLKNLLMNRISFPTYVNVAHFFFCICVTGCVTGCGYNLARFYCFIVIFCSNLVNSVQLVLFLAVWKRVLTDSVVKVIKSAALCSVGWHDILCITVLLVVSFWYMLNINFVGFLVIVMSK
jgi:hypothetical protein